MTVTEMDARREQLKGLDVSVCSHPGLLFDKFLVTQEKPSGKDESEQARTALVKAVGDLEYPAQFTQYKHFFKRWDSALDNLGAFKRKAEAIGRLSVGLGSESVIETSISFHRTYGVPVIPGSALKGLASAYAHQQLEGEEWRKAVEGKPQGAAHRTVFGSSADNNAEAGFVTFFDALWIPPEGGAIEARPFAPDIMSVHHAEYYQASKDIPPPADWDTPTVIPFLTATGSFLIALAGPDEWVDTTFEILGLALAEYGVGAKTSSGYGRMKLAPKPVDPDFLKAESIISKVNALNEKVIPSQLFQKIQGWEDLRDGSIHKLKVSLVIREQGKKWKGAKDKEWFQQVLKYIEANEGK